MILLRKKKSKNNDYLFYAAVFIFVFVSVYLLGSDTFTGSALQAEKSEITVASIKEIPADVVDEYSEQFSEEAIEKSFGSTTTGTPQSINEIPDSEQIVEEYSNVPTKVGSVSVIAGGSASTGTLSK